MAADLDRGIDIKLTSMDTFPLWKFQINIFLKANGLSEVVQGMVDPKEVETKPDLLQKDARAQKLIVSSMDQSLIVHVMNCNTSKEMYDAILKIFERDNDEQKYVLLQEFYNFKYDVGSDMMTNISRLKLIISKLNILGQGMDESMAVTKIITILPEEYRMFTTAWESTTASEKTLANLTSRLVSEELKLKKGNTESVAFKAEKGVRKCFICRRPGHEARRCPNRDNSERRGHPQASSAPVVQRYKPCRFCKRTNHPEEKCYFKNKKENPVSFMASIGKDDRQKPIELVVDSGCTTHMINDRDALTNIMETKSTIKVAKENAAMEAVGVGMLNGNECILKEVLLVPELSRNLLSVNAVTENGGTVEFKRGEVIIKKGEEVVIRGTKAQNGLYTINLTMCKEESIDSHLAVNWHKRMGHLGFDNLKKLQQIATGIKLDGTEQPKVCEVCIQAKQTRLPFNSVRERATRPLQIIHTDVMGPISPPTWDGKSYVLTILDDYTHFCQVYLLSNKYEVAKELRNCVSEMEAMHNLKVAKIRCDNGGEFKNEELQGWCRRKGIVIDYTIPHSPQLNGRAERLNRTLMDKTRALLYDSNLDKEMWGVAVQTAAYLLNRSPTETLEDATPAEKWFNRRPNLENIRLFGCDAYVKELGHLRKLDSRSRKLVLVGYAPNGYRLWDEKKKRIIIGRDVVFSENGREKGLNIGETKGGVSIEVDKEQNKAETYSEEMDLQILPHDLSCQEQEENYRNLESETEIPDDGKGRKVQQSQEGRRYDLRDRNEIRLPKRFEDYEIETSLLTYEEAINGPEKHKWQTAINDEMDSLLKNDTWQLVEKPKNVNVIDNKWVFTKKVDEKGNVTKFKARLVAKGFNQEEGFDFHETYAPVAKLPTIRTVLAVANYNNMEIDQMDVKTAFLNGELDEELYMKEPPGFETEKDVVCKLSRPLYGLKQSPRCWNQRFNDFILQQGFTRSRADYCLYTKITEADRLYVVLYVDDLIIAGTNRTEIDELKTTLNGEFEMRDLGDIGVFLNLKITRENTTLTIDQRHYITKIIKDFRMEECKHMKAPMETKLKLTRNEGSPTRKPYKQLLGSLVYLMLGSRPDLGFSVSYMSQFQDNASDEHFEYLKRIVRYIKGTKDLKLEYNSETKEKRAIVGYVDADWANGDDRRSVSGFLYKVYGCTVSWCSQKQSTVAISSTEAEYISLAACICEGMWLRNLLMDLGINLKEPITLYEDNQPCISIAKNPGNHKRSKHFDTKYHFVREQVNNGTFKLEYIESRNQPADILTKSVNSSVMEDAVKTMFTS